VLFPNNDVVFQDDSLIHIARSVQSCFEEHEDARQHLLWPAQMPNLNIIEPLWSVLEEQLEEEWYSIPLETSQNLYESVPRRIQAVLQANCGPTPC